jgi:bilirubin oxidase
MKMKKKIIVAISLITLLIIVGIVLLLIETDSFQSRNSVEPLVGNLEGKVFGHAQLTIPPLIDSRENNLTIKLEIIESQKEFYEGIKSDTYGYNGNFLGPTIKAYEGDNITITYNNQLLDDTTVHKHGLHVSGNVDGGPQNKILTGESLTEVLEIRQEASTNWYHPHLMGKSATQVHNGLAGMFIIEDENSERLGLPNDYGINDIPLIVQDRYFVDGVMNYKSGLDEEFIGNTVIINGNINPELIVPKGLVRFRLLNGANARVFRFSFSDNRDFLKIATEGGFLETGVSINEITMAPGERNEIIVDFSNTEEVFLVTDENPGQEKRDSTFRKVKILRIATDETIPNQIEEIPEKLNSIDFFSEEDVVKTRTFILENNDEGHDHSEHSSEDGHGHGSMTINGVSMDPNVINERVILGDLEKWVISSEHGVHPFHLHGASFQIISQDDQPTKLEDRGWKDTVFFQNKAEVLVKFNFEATEEFPYMYHCHVLEHEEMGMMGQFTVLK